ncbi:MAG: biosynthetic-type acetolactate synthase large subunit [Lachnospiraceae bacterium]|nr:biosynthetic-type acetolactate synthase large subunit [Lachnospiraceae bacterium]
MLMTGAKILMECLLEQGVDTVFGYPGGTNLNVYDELYKYSDRIHNYLTSHEQGAAHAADGYARSTGKVGVCMATSGPGATNLTTGVATAHLDSSPVVFITCNVSASQLGKDAFQEADVIGIMMPITKAQYLIRDVESLADSVREAFALARSGRPGPVLIDILKDVTVQKAEYNYLPLEQHYLNGSLSGLMRRATTSALRMPEPDREDIRKLVDMIAESEKPMLICGGGVTRSRAHMEFREFARRLDAPVAITLMGGGAMPGDDPLSTGMIGMHGSQASNRAVDGCDLLIAVGTRFSDRVALKPSTFARNAKIVHIDIDRAEINKNVPTDHHIIGNARVVLAQLNSLIPEYDHSEWKRYVFSFPRETEYDAHSSSLSPREILSTISDMMPEETIVATDVGEHQMWAIQHFHFSYPGQLLTSGGFGTMGFGLGAAIGAKVGNPGATVIHVTGDGSFRMNCNELATEEYYKTPVITFIFNNGCLGMVRQWQELMYDGRYSATILDRGPDFVKLAEAYGLKGARVSNVDELKTAITDALHEYEEGRGYVIECSVAQSELVRPMVNGGTHITEFLLNRPGKGE